MPLSDTSRLPKKTSEIHMLQIDIIVKSGPKFRLCDLVSRSILKKRDALKGVVMVCVQADRSHAKQKEVQSPNSFVFPVLALESNEGSRKIIMKI
jgi:hypothetical protein